MNIIYFMYSKLHLKYSLSLTLYSSNNICTIFSNNISFHVLYPYNTCISSTVPVCNLHFLLFI